MRIGIGLLAASLSALVLTMAVSGAKAAESVVLSAAALKAALAERPPEGSEPGDSDKPVTFGTAGAMHAAAVSGAPFDVIILTPPLTEDLVKRGLVDGATVHPLGTMRLGAAVKAGAAHPAIDTPDHFRQTLIDAASIAVADPKSGATTGIYLEKLFASMGLSATLSPKLKMYPDGQNAMEAVAHGEAAIAIGQISEGLPVEGIDMLGPIPDAQQLKTTYVAAIAMHPVDRSLAEKTLARLLGPRFKGVLQGQGFDVAP
jgi:molybdate transport system substrate-binding protein